MSPGIRFCRSSFPRRLAVCTSRRLAARGTGLQEFLAKGTHLLLYALLVAQVTLAFYRWAQEKTFSFGLFATRIIHDAAWAHPIREFHNDVA